MGVALRVVLRVGRRSLLATFATIVITSRASAQRRLSFTVPDSSRAGLDSAMRTLASQALVAYRDTVPERALENTAYLQLAAGRLREATETLAELGTAREGRHARQAAAATIPLAIWAAARLRTPAVSFDSAFRTAFRATMGGVRDQGAALMMRSLAASPAGLEQTLQRSMPRATSDSIALTDALQLLKQYVRARAYRDFEPLTPALISEDDERRYVITHDVQVPTRDGTAICATVVRPRAVRGQLTTLLNFTIYADPVASLNEARRTASHGYAGVEGFTRGKACSPATPVPYEQDGTDADDLINWIAKQPWSDGRVGMYGGSYEGFTQWAAAKRLPPALKALMPSVSAAPGIDVPMEGNIFQNFVYYWPLYAASGPDLDTTVLNDWRRWNNLNNAWYTSGRAYRDLDQIDGTPNPIFDRWLDHPSYDRYWQGMIPYGQEFARIGIPVLTTTGYYDGGEIGALYYLQQHYRFDPSAEHYLVIGPYDHVRGQRGTVSPLGDEFDNLRGYELDSVAHLDLGELRYQWFDYVFRGGPKPAILGDRINYELMGANQWRHAPSLAAMARETRRFYLTATPADSFFRLSRDRPARDSFVLQSVDLADRSDVDRVPLGNGMFDTVLDTWNSVAYVSEPLAAPVAVAGLFSGRLDFAVNKRDLDLYVSLYELTPEGKYLWLTYYMARASQARNREQRELLTPGVRQQVDFRSGRLIGRQFQAGSRLVAVLSILRQPNIQINYGTGKDVSDETMADAGAPLEVRWFTDSYIDLPVSP